MDQISFADFSKIDIRTGEIIRAEAVPKSEKLLKLEVYLGPEIGYRTILASLAKSFNPDSLIGRHVLVVVNLAPRKMMGIESHGMILATYQEDGTLSLASCLGVPLGSQIG